MKINSYFSDYDEDAEEKVDWDVREEMFQDLLMLQDGLQKTATPKQLSSLACFKRYICSWFGPSKFFSIFNHIFSFSVVRI